MPRVRNVVRAVVNLGAVLVVLLAASLSAQS